MVVRGEREEPPGPGPAANWPEFTERLRELYAWCGRPKYTTLSSISGLAPSAISNLIGRNPLSRPPKGTALRFVEACLARGGYPPEAVRERSRRWERAWTALSAGGPGTAPAPDATSDAIPDAIPDATVAPGPSDDGGANGGVNGGGDAVRSRRAKAAVVAGAALVTLGTAAWAALSWSPSPPAAEPAAGGDQPRCLRHALAVADARMGQTWQGVFMCPNTPGTKVYEWARRGLAIGRLETNPSWFVCWVRGERHDGGNDVWYYTQGDYSAAKKELQAWGFVPAVELGTTTDPDPAVARECGFGPGPAA